MATIFESLIAMDGNRTKLHGKITKGVFSPGSKSEHTAIFLETDAGKYKLQQLGANPFQNTLLNNLVGRTLDLEGVLLENENVFLVEEGEIRSKG